MGGMGNAPAINPNMAGNMMRNGMGGMGGMMGGMGGGMGGMGMGGMGMGGMGGNMMGMNNNMNMGQFGVTFYSNSIGISRLTTPNRLCRSRLRVCKSKLLPSVRCT
jgi:hypothetical protein